MIGPYTDQEFRTFLRQYRETALWSCTDLEGRPLSDQYTLRHMTCAALERTGADCVLFVQMNADDLGEINDPEQSGHDFWLTRNGAGEGFWSRGYDDELAKRLTESCYTFGMCEVYPGVDDRLQVF